MREALVIRALKDLSLRIGLIWVGTNGFGNPLGITPDVATLDRAAWLIETYTRARTAYEAGDYLGAIEIATEDEAHE